MNIKFFGTLCVLLSTFGLASTFAQSAAVSGTVSPQNAPKSELVASPSITSGVHSVIEGNFSSNKSGNSNTVGPYLSPAINLAYTIDQVKAGINFELEMGTSRGFGSEKNGNRSFSDNTYMDHHPVVTLSVGKTTKFNFLADMLWHVDTKANANNFSDLFFNPEVEHRLNPQLAFAVGYVQHRVSKYDTAAVSPTSLNSEVGGSVAKPAILPNNNAPVNILNAGVVTARVKLSETAKVETYVRAGRLTTNARKNGEDLISANSYRFQTDFTSKPASKLSLALRYRLNIDDRKANFVTVLNRGRIIAEYALTNAWTLSLNNTFDAITNPARNSKAVFGNEQYVGLGYAF
ncbi:MAG: hypothetical protein J0L93_07840 [Deltaproteobacteria bacterium]|nr:hypothetical protein [Deltaproteobacteria bacterium]